MKRIQDSRPINVIPLSASVRRCADGTVYVSCGAEIESSTRNITERLEHWAALAPGRTFLAQRDSKGGILLTSALAIGHSRYKLVATNEADTVNKTHKSAICFDDKVVEAGFGGPLVQTDGPCPHGIGSSVAAVIEAERPSLVYWGFGLTFVGFAFQIPAATLPLFGK